MLHVCMRNKQPKIIWFWIRNAYLLILIVPLIGELCNSIVTRMSLIVFQRQWIDTYNLFIDCRLQTPDKHLGIYKIGWRATIILFYFIRNTNPDIIWFWIRNAYLLVRICILRVFIHIQFIIIKCKQPHTNFW